jgi:hypothetical protein
MQMNDLTSDEKGKSCWHLGRCCHLLPTAPELSLVLRSRSGVLEKGEDSGLRDHHNGGNWGWSQFILQW